VAGGDLQPELAPSLRGGRKALQLALRAMSFMWAQVPGWERMAETFLVLAFERLKSRFPEAIPAELAG
jgi:hypothetical protein